ncbi:MAG TPA: hypothetical protein VGR07_04950, partial [Thermoanaerobaculia bacterium]|nr:hypothetical protein [Thermoanaerobaculia bacterium]
MELPRRSMLALAALLLSAPAPPAPPAAPQPGEELLAFLHTVAVAGREDAATAFVRSRLAGLPVESDALGNVVVTLGSGEPRRLVACPLGEPGFVVSDIQEDGYLRLLPAGNGPVGALWEQTLEGQAVTIGSAGGPVPGVVAVRSVHLEERRPGIEPLPFGLAEAYVDVGAENAAEVAALGLRRLDPVALVRRPVELRNGLLAGPAARTKGAALALAAAARRFHPTPGRGTVTFAWTTQDLWSRSGLAHLLGRRGPFAEVLLLSPGFGPAPLPPPGSPLLAAGALAALPGVQAAPHLEPPPLPAPGWGAARVGYLGLPAFYSGTPVEAVAPDDLKRLAETLLAFLGGIGTGGEAAAPPLPPVPSAPPRPTAREHAEAADLLGELLVPPAVSGAEGPVRETVLRHLPSWARPEVDPTGNVRLTFGPTSGAGRVLFVAHMDEVGFRVEALLPDGRLRLARRGGLKPSLWEAQAAVVHGDRGDLPAVFEPRPDWATAERRAPAGELTVNLGAASAAAARALGVREGSTVTMPKRMLRLGAHRVTGRSCDDRVGSTALLLALRRLDPGKLRHPVTFAWSVGEEVGLEGARALAGESAGYARVYPVDTFVSSDSPLESRRFAYAPLGRGAVLRAMDNAFLAPRELIDRTLALANREGIAVQLGVTGGATDGVPFLPSGAAMLPLSWPGRYSHSPV